MRMIGICLVLCFISILLLNWIWSSKGVSVLEIKEEPGVFIKYKEHEHKINEDGTLYIIKASSEGVLIVEPANLDDCRRILEENGQG